ncbi:MAG: type II toxin-antitoxin system RelE/ParE family toxin [Candidatus Riflebacteria bacterium]|nr:type II toxin-antitoxin system RelE/ParE family toxin [Candidatus Riflebacteria bacterium]
MKAVEVLISEEAVDDLEAGKAFYDEIELGVGEYFIDCLLADFGSLRFYGGIHEKHFGCFRMLAKRFPFAIYYNFVKSVVTVIGVLDTRRNPAWLRKQVIERKDKRTKI